MSFYGVRVFRSFSFCFRFCFLPPWAYFRESVFLWRVSVDRNLLVDLFGSESVSGPVARMVFIVQADIWSRAGDG